MLIGALLVSLVGYVSRFVFDRLLLVCTCLLLVVCCLLSVAS